MKITAFIKRNRIKLLMGLIVLCTALGAAFIGTAGTDQQTASAEETTTISGWYEFKNTISKPSAFIQENIDVYINGVQYNRIIVALQPTISVKKAEEPQTYLYTASTGWYDDSYREMDFGSSPVTVSTTFYNWLIANATQKPEYKIPEGTYIWNDTPELGSFAGEFTLDFSIITNDFKMESKNKIIVTVASIQYQYNDDADSKIIAYSNHQWNTPSENRTIFINEQTVTPEFFDWFQANTERTSDIKNFTAIIFYFQNTQIEAINTTSGSPVYSFEHGEPMYIKGQQIIRTEVQISIKTGYEIDQITTAQCTLTKTSNGFYDLVITKYTVATITLTTKETEEPEPGPKPDDETKVITPSWYEFNDTITLPDSTLTEEIDFIANNMTFSMITIDGSQIKYGEHGTIAYNPAWGGWMNGMQPEILIQSNQYVSGEFYEWFQANLTMLNGYDSYLEGYNQGYEQGKADGYEEGKTQGYNQGYYEGAADAGDYSFLNLLTAVVDAPVTVFVKLLDFEILGWNMTTVVISLLSVALIVTLIAYFSGKK